MQTTANMKVSSGTVLKLASSSNSPSIHQLVQRISAEVNAADKRVRSLQSEAEAAFSKRERASARFIAIADRIHAILLPRLQALTNENVFNDVKQHVSLESRGHDSRGFHARTTTMTVPHSDKRPKAMQFSFRVGHDGTLQNAVVDYRLEILPIFLRFERQDQHLVPIDDLSEKTVSAWIDDKLIGFTKTYFEVYFHNEYQKTHLEMDPVLKIRFPRAMAVSSEEYQSHTYHFYTEASSRRFQENPDAYIKTV